MPSVIRPTFQPTAEQLRLMETVDKAWAEVEAAETKAWQATQALRVAGIPDLAICDRYEQVSRATMNRRLGPRPPKVD